MPIEAWPEVSRHPGWRWYRGDFHLHTTYSDGAWTVAELLASAVERGLDFVALTDHNATGAWAEAAACNPPGLLVIPGVELGQHDGHAVCLRLHECPYTAPPSQPWDMAAAADAVHRAGGLFAIAHPFTDEPGCRWEHPFIPDQCDALEIWNGEPWLKDNNDRNMGLWHNWLQAGRRLPGISGSDAHRLEHWRRGTAFDYVYAPELSQEAILANMLAGRLFLSSGPWLWLEGRRSAADAWAIPGDTLAPAPVLNWRATWRGARAASWLGIRRNGSLIHAQDVTEAGQVQIEDPGEPGWCTAEVWAGDGNLLATTNPLFIG